MTTLARPSAPDTTDSGVPAAPVAGAVLDLVDRSRTGLLAACHATGSGERYTLAHLAALRAAAALLAARGRIGQRSRPRSVWETVPAAAPELTEWAAFFAASGRRRQAIERGVEVGTREADDLVRQAETFLDLVLAQLGLPVQASVTTCVAPITHA
jgi:SAV_6107-like HEPN